MFPISNVSSKDFEGFKSTSPRSSVKASLTTSHGSKTRCLHNRAVNPELIHREPANLPKEHHVCCLVRIKFCTNSQLKGEKHKMLLAS